MNEWQRAIDDELIMAFLGTTETPEYSDPRKALNAIICWHTDVAVDPSVSQTAADLYMAGYQAGWKHARDWWESQK